MRDPFERTKVVVRHLPPAITEPDLLEKIESRFSGRFKWFCFRPGKNSQRHWRYSRAYIDFNKPEDVLEFAEFLNGHVFVNEKGAQFKTIVEYAPSQRIPKSWMKKDGREGTIFKDPEYLEFLELLSKPADNLPSAEIQLERKEAERAGQQKEFPIITPLMDYVRQKRAAKSGTQRSSSNGKLSRRAGGIAPSNSGSASSKRGSEKRKTPTSMYVLRDGTKSTNGKEKSLQLLMQKRDEQQLMDKAVPSVGAEVEEVSLSEGSTTGISGMVDIGKKKVMLLKGKEKDISSVFGDGSQHAVTSNARSSQISTPAKSISRRDASGRIVRSILSSKDSRQNQSSSRACPSEQLLPNSDRERRPPRPTNAHNVLKDHISSYSSIADGDNKIIDDKNLNTDSRSFVFTGDKHDKRARNKDKGDRGVWAPLRRLEGSHSVDESPSSFLVPVHMASESLEYMTISQQIVPCSKVGDEAADDIDGGSNVIGVMPRSVEGVHHTRTGQGALLISGYESGEAKSDLSGSGRSGDVRPLSGSRSSLCLTENGLHRHASRRGFAQGLKEVDGCSVLSAEVKPTKRGGTGYGSHEKQVWVLKSGSGS